VLVAVFEPGVHGTHEHAILQRCEAEIERREQMWVLRVDKFMSVQAS
jgi:hypothetical protein